MKKVGFGMLLCDSFNFFHEGQGLGKVFNLSVFWRAGHVSPHIGDSTTTPLRSPEFFLQPPILESSSFHIF